MSTSFRFLWQLFATKSISAIQLTLLKMMVLNMFSNTFEMKLKNSMLQSCLHQPLKISTWTAFTNIASVKPTMNINSNSRQKLNSPKPWSQQVPIKILMHLKQNFVTKSKKINPKSKDPRLSLNFSHLRIYSKKEQSNWKNQDLMSLNLLRLWNQDHR